MKVNKIPIRPNKIGIDLVLCPKTTLYLQDLYCRRCPYFELDNGNYIQCKFIRPKYGQSDPVKDKLITDLSSSFIKELPVDDKKRAVNNFTQRIKESKATKSENEVVNKDLTQYMRKTNLTTRLKNIKKDPSKA